MTTMAYKLLCPQINHCFLKLLAIYMDGNVYLLATDAHGNCRDVIHSRDTSLRIKVFCPSEQDFTPNSNELQLYGYANGRLYAFETVNLLAEDAIDVVGAIKWYAAYIGSPQMEILPEDPRQQRGAAAFYRDQS